MSAFCLLYSYEDRFQVGVFSVLIQQQKSYIVQLNNKKISIQEWSLLAHGKMESDDEWVNNDREEI